MGTVLYSVLVYHLRIWGSLLILKITLGEKMVSLLPLPGSFFALADFVCDGDGLGKRLKVRGCLEECLRERKKHASSVLRVCLGAGQKG
jgi:hypothetical protein